jgi:hypothetical protein
MHEALLRIANGEGYYGAQAKEYKDIARAALAQAGSRFVPPESKEPKGGWKTPAGKLLGVEIPPPCACSDGVVNPLCWHHGIESQSRERTDP